MQTTIVSQDLGTFKAKVELITVLAFSTLLVAGGIFLQLRSERIAEQALEQLSTVRVTPMITFPPLLLVSDQEYTRAAVACLGGSKALGVLVSEELVLMPQSKLLFTQDRHPLRVFEVSNTGACRFDPDADTALSRKLGGIDLTEPSVTGNPGLRLRLDVLQPKRDGQHRFAGRIYR